MTLAEAKKLIEFCESKSIKRVKFGTFEVEFIEKQTPMALDPLSLSKALTDSMPPDSAMLLASVDEEMQTPYGPSVDHQE